MSSSEGEEDNELYANLDSSDSSASDSEEEITSSDEEDGDESLRGARRWYQLPVDNLQPAPPPFPFTGDPRARVGRPSTPHPTRGSSGHYPMDVPATEKKKFPTRKCAQCAKKRDANGKKVRKETRYLCKICQVPLCVTPCFEAYHTE